MDYDDRLIDLETRLAYQDDTLRILSDALARQQRDLEQLTALCQQLLERVRTQGAEQFKGSPADEVPPHY